MSIKRILGWGLTLFISASIIVYLVSLASLNDHLSAEDVTVRDRYYGEDSKSLDYVYLMYSHTMEIGNPEGLISDICIFNNMENCDKDVVLDQSNYTDDVLDESALNYFNVYAFGLLSDKYYNSGDLEGAMRAMAASMYYSERLANVSDEFYKISLVKFANLLDLKNKEKDS